MTLEPKVLQRYVRKLYRFLEQGHKVRFKKLRVNRGYIEHKEDKVSPASVTLDHREELLKTLIHEFLHYIHPEWSEAEVLDMEDRIADSLSERQVRNIIKRLAQAL